MQGLGEWVSQSKKNWANHNLVICVFPRLSPFSCNSLRVLLFIVWKYCFNTIEQCFNVKTFIATTLVCFNDSQHVNKLYYYFSIRVLILSALVKCRKGELEHDRKNFRKALSYYTEGIELKCKDDETNAKLYYRRSHSHWHLGKLTLLLLFFNFLLKSV